LLDAFSNPGAEQHQANEARFDRSSVFDITIHRYLPAAACYFFLNHAGLPNGLFYTTILSPFFFIWLYLKGHRWLTTRFLLALLPFVLAQMALGISAPFYFVQSTLLLWTVFVTVYALFWALKNSSGIERLFDQLIFLNLCVAMFALAALFTPLKLTLWKDESGVLSGTSHLLRLSLLTTEPSVYAELMLPLMIFAAIRLLRDPTARNLLYLIMIGVPLLLSQSFGGLSIGLAGIGIAIITSYRRLLTQPRNLMISACLVIAVCALLLTHNPLSERVVQVATGGDSSTKSRTIFSFIVAFAVASSKSLLWGVGLGQSKLVDVSNLGLPFTVGVIPNAVAGTFAEFGIIGVAVRFFVEFYLFFRTKVYRNSFRLAMFVAAFIAQTTGSHMMDVQQYLMWCFAFFPFFPDLNLRDKSSTEISYS
jgi:hypothetical protein